MIEAKTESINYAAAMGIGFNLVQDIIAAAADGVISSDEVLHIVKDAIDAYSAATGHALQVSLPAGA